MTSTLKSWLAVLFIFTAVALHGQVNNCTYFDGADDYILIGDVNDLGTSNFTIEAWVYINSFTSTGHKVINKGLSSVGTPSNAGYALRVDNQLGDDLDFTVGHSDGSITSVTYNGLSTNTWHHIAGVRVEKTLFLYVDGVLVGTGTTAVIYNVDTDLPLGIGAIHKGGLSPVNEYFDGQIDEVRIWNQQRFDWEIDTYKDCAITAPEPNLVAVYNLNETAGTIAADSSGYGNHGSLENGPIWVSSPVATLCTVGIDENESDSFSFYPNPASDNVTISFENTTNTTYTLTLVDATGKAVETLTTTDNQVELDVAGLAKGFYVVQLSDDSGIISTDKLVVE